MDFGRLIEEQLRKAREEGKFDNLRGHGQPLDLSENPFEDPTWRLANDMSVEPLEADPVLAAQLREVVARLGLRMGVFDLKVRPDGHVVFLEVNPQGQFLFVEGMSDMPLGEAFAAFAARELASVAQRR